MKGYLAERLLQAAFVVLFVSAVTFVMLRLTGADPSTVLLPFDASPEQRAFVRHAYGFDQPLPAQFWAYLVHAAQGDFGTSIRYSQPALGLVLDRLPATLELAVYGMVLSVVIGVPLGTAAAVRQGGFVDRVAVGASLLGQAAPSFWLGIVMILFFSVILHWLPTSGRGGFANLVMPVSSLSAFFVPQVVLLVRTGMLDALSEPYVQTARAKGLSERVVLFRHALRNVLIPVITMVGLNFGTLLGGAVVTESVFAWPGVGLLALQATYSTDYPIVQAAVFVVSLGVVATNLVVDLLYGLADPRIRSR